MWDDYFADPTEEKRLAIYEHYRAKRFINRIAGKMLLRIPQTPMIDEEDLVAAGELALWQCIERFDPTSGASFPTFAGNRIRGAMLDWVRQADWISRRGREEQRRGGDEPPDMCSLDQLAGSVEPDVEEDEPAMCAEVIRELMRHLDHLQRKAVRLLYLERLRPEQVAIRLRCNPSRVKEIRAEVLERLRSRACG